MSSQELLIDAVCGKKDIKMETWEVATKRGYAVYTGNQWNPGWRWDRSRLEDLDIEELRSLYDDPYTFFGPYKQDSDIPSTATGILTVQTVCKEAIRLLVNNIDLAVLGTGASKIHIRRPTK